VIDRDAPANFIYLNPPWNTNDPAVRMANFPLVTTKRIDDKRTFWSILEEKGNSHYTPKTYLDLETFSEEEELEQTTGHKCLFYLKEARGVHQKGVWCCEGVDQVRQEVAQVAKTKHKSAKDWMKQGCIQKGVDDMYLVQGRKFNMRVYAVIVNWRRPDEEEPGKGEIKVYLFESVHMRVFSEAHDESSTDPKVQIGIDGHTYQLLANTDLDCWEEVLPQLRDSVKNVCLSFDWKRSRKSTVAEFALLGFDYLVDSNKKIWNIEVNDWPCIEWKETERGAMTSQFKQLVTDFYTLLVAPVFQAKEPHSMHLNEI